MDAGRAPYLVADVTPLEDEIGDEARAERLAATAVRRFVRYLDLMRVREGETGEALDVRVELDSPASDEPLPGNAAGEPIGVSDPDRLESDRLEAVPASSHEQETSLAIPDDPTVLSYLLSGIAQVELPRRQQLLEAETTVERLEQLVTLLDREVFLLERRLRVFTPDARVLGGARRS